MQTSSAGAISRRGDDESTWIARGNLPGKTHNPDEKEQKRIYVEWGEVTEGPDALLHIKGKLLVESPDGKTRKPVDWAQGVRVVLARSSKNRPDWSKRHDEKDSVWSDCIAIEKGAFEGDISLDRMQRTVGKTESYQVAVTLGKRGFNIISFTNTVPVLSQTMGTIRI